MSNQQFFYSNRYLFENQFSLPVYTQTGFNEFNSNTNNNNIDNNNNNNINNNNTINSNNNFNFNFNNINNINTTTSLENFYNQLKFTPNISTTPITTPTPSSSSTSISTPLISTSIISTPSSSSSSSSNVSSNEQPVTIFTSSPVIEAFEQTSPEAVDLYLTNSSNNSSTADLLSTPDFDLLIISNNNNNNTSKNNSFAFQKSHQQHHHQNQHQQQQQQPNTLSSLLQIPTFHNSSSTRVVKSKPTSPIFKARSYVTPIDTVAHHRNPFSITSQSLPEFRNHCLEFQGNNNNNSNNNSNNNNNNNNNADHTVSFSPLSPTSSASTASVGSPFFSTEDDGFVFSFDTGISHNNNNNNNNNDNNNDILLPSPPFAPATLVVPPVKPANPKKQRVKVQGEVPLEIQNIFENLSETIAEGNLPVCTMTLEQGNYSSTTAYAAMEFLNSNYPTSQSVTEALESSIPVVVLAKLLPNAHLRQSAKNRGIILTPQATSHIIRKLNCVDCKLSNNAKSEFSAILDAKVTNASGDKITLQENYAIRFTYLESTKTMNNQQCTKSPNCTRRRHRYELVHKFMHYYPENDTVAVVVRLGPDSYEEGDL